MKTRPDPMHAIDNLVNELNPDLSNTSMSRMKRDSWDDWRSHLPQAVVILWPTMSDRERRIAFVCANSVTSWEPR